MLPSGQNQLESEGKTTIKEMKFVCGYELYVKKRCDQEHCGAQNTGVLVSEPSSITQTFPKFLFFFLLPLFPKDYSLKSEDQTLCCLLGYSAEKDKTTPALLELCSYHGDQ